MVGGRKTQRDMSKEGVGGVRGGLRTWARCPASGMLLQNVDLWAQDL